MVAGRLSSEHCFRGIRARARAVLLVAICITLPASVLACANDTSLEHLVAQLHRAAEKSVNASQLSNIRRLTHKVQMGEGSDRLAAAGLTQHNAEVARLLDQARRISRQGGVRDQTGLRRNLRATERLIELACQGYSSADSSMSSQSGVAAGARANTDTGGEAAVFASRRRSILLLGSILALALTIPLVLLGGQYAYRMAYAMRFNRKSCRIHSALECELDVADGTVTILGLKGCRFRPVNKGAYDRVVHMTRDRVFAEDVHLVIGRHRVPGFIDGLHETFVVIFFLQPLPLKLQTKFLDASTITPQYKPGKTPKSNVPGAVRRRPA